MNKNLLIVLAFLLFNMGYGQGTINASSTTLPSLASIYGQASNTDVITISGIDIDGRIDVTPPLGFEVSRDGSTFADAISINTLTGGKGNIAATSIYVRLKRMIAAQIYSGNLVLTSPGASNIIVRMGPGIVNKAPLTIDAESKEKVYGDENPSLTATYSGFVTGENINNLTTPVKIETAANKTSNAGKYDIEVSGGDSPNYMLFYNSNPLIITKAPLTITATSDSRDYGKDNLGFTVSYSGFKNGDTEANLTAKPEVATTADKTSSAGDYDIIASGATSLNYDFTYNKGVLTVKPISLVITADNLDVDYGAVIPVLTAKYDGFANGDTPASLGGAFKIETAAIKGSAAGKYDIVISGATSPNYNFTYNKGILTIKAVSLVITTNDSSKTYGSDNPLLTVSYVGFISGESEVNLSTKPTIVTIADKGSQVNKYEITASGAVSSNYTITYDNKGLLDVTPAALTITTNDNSKTYGSDNPLLTVSYVGFIAGESEVNLSTKPTIVTIADKGSAVKKYEITASGAVSSNYTITYDNKGLLDVTPAPLTIIANKVKKIHGETNPTFTVEYVEFVNGDTAVKLDSQVVISTEATADSAIGKYTIAVDGATSKNYTIKFVDGILDVIASSNADLSDIIINKGVLDPVFDMDQKGYTVVVPNETNSYVINPIPSNPNATVVMKVDGVIVDPTTPLDLKVGDNVITIEVTAEDGITKETYEVIVTREPSSDSGLTDLAISEGTLSPAFAEGIIAYTATVPYDIANITVTPITTDTTATVTVNGKEVPSGTASTDLPLKVGENTITTVVTAQDGTTTTYTVVVTREEAPLSSDAGLSDIVVSDGTLSPAFNTDTKGYSVDVPYETDSIIITPKAIDPDAKVEMIVDGITITDNKSPIDLKVGENEITVVVTAPDGTQETYIVVVNRADAIPQAIIPTNIITPNGDGKNDFWIVPGLDKYPNNSVKVFDRAARLVYSKNNYNNEWDGTYKGSPLNEDTYYYLIDLGNGSPKMKGFISIIRDNN